MTSSPTSTPGSAPPKAPNGTAAAALEGPAAAVLTQYDSRRLDAGSHIGVTIFAIAGTHFVDSLQVMSASDSPGLLAGNPPYAAGCPG